MGQVIHKDDDTVRINQCFQIDKGLALSAHLCRGVSQMSAKACMGEGGQNRPTNCVRT